MSKKRPLKLRDLLAKLKPFGVVRFADTRGKGSEIILVKPVGADPTKGPQHSLKNHGLGTEISVPVILSILGRFEIDPNKFWD